MFTIISLQCLKTLSDCYQEIAVIPDRLVDSPWPQKGGWLKQAKLVLRNLGVVRMFINNSSLQSSLSSVHHTKNTTRDQWKVVS
jgi:hypothetical protein